MYKTPLILALVLLANSAVASFQMRQEGRVRAEQKISETSGLIPGTLDGYDYLGRVTNIGDLNGDGVVDLAVGVPYDSDGSFYGGAVWILFLAEDGTVSGQAKISDTHGGFTGVLHEGDAFGFALAGLGDLDGDCVPDLAVGAVGDDDLGSFVLSVGAVWILFLNPDGSVKGYQKTIPNRPGFPGVVFASDVFTYAMASLGDLDGDGVTELAVTAPSDDDNRGALWILFLRRNGTVKGYQKISSTEGGFVGPLSVTASFGKDATSVGDLDGDGVPDLAVGSVYDDPYWTGAVWILLLNADGTVKSDLRIDGTSGGFSGQLDLGDSFWHVAGLGDIDGDGVNDLAVGARGDDDGGRDRGAVWILTLYPDGSVKTNQKISDRAGGFGGVLDDGDQFGYSIALLGDLDGDGFSDLAVDALYDDDGGPDRGAIWILFMGQGKELPSSTPLAGGTVVLPMERTCLLTQPRILLRAAGPVALGSIPVLWLRPATNTAGSLFPPFSPATVLIGQPSLHGSARFALPDYEALAGVRLESWGFFFSTHDRIVPARATLLDPLAALPR